MCEDRKRVVRGTSYSAPITNGICACVRAANATFNLWPELVRVALMVSSLNVDGAEWNCRVDGRDGAGVICGSQAVYFAKNATNQSPNPASGVQMGYYAGPWYNTETTGKTFKVTIPAIKPIGQHLRVVLTWDSRPDLTAATNQLSDLDLIGFYAENSSYYSSSSWDGSVEIIDVPRANLTAGKTYSFTVYPATIRLPANTTYFYYAVGWKWVADHAQ